MARGPGATRGDRLFRGFSGGKFHACACSLSPLLDRHGLGRWDHHGDNFGALRQDLPLLDQGLSALIEDLHQRGLDKDVSIVVWGEFGRTPTINKDAGRDHWPRVSCALLAGGGLKHGQVIGATDRLGGEAVERPVQFGEVFATLYHGLGIDVAKATVNDLSGRPQYLVDNGLQAMKELV